MADTDVPPRNSRFDFGQAVDDSAFNQSDDMNIGEEEVPDLVIPAFMLPVVALLIIGIIFYLIKRVVDFTSTGKKDSDVRFEVDLPTKLITIYEETKERYEDGKATLDELKTALQKRAFADLNCMFRLQNEAKSLRQAELMGKLPNSLRDDFVTARTKCEQELNIVKAEAEDLEEGYGNAIMQWAAKTISESNKAKHQQMKQQMDADMAAGMMMINEASKRDPSLSKLSDQEKRQRVSQQIKIKHYINHLQSRGLTQEQIELELRRNNISIVKDNPEGSKKNE